MRHLALCAVLALALTAQAQQKLKVYISADLEGIGGVATGLQAGPDGRDYPQARKLMTQEVNAAIAGAYDAGATEVLVADSHGDAQNIDPEVLDRRARLIRAWPRPLGMMGGIDQTFDAVVFIGYHAREGTAEATLSHTISGGKLYDISLNGKSMPEAGLNAAVAGEFGVPVVFLSGDQTIGAQAKEIIGPIETVAVKEAAGFFSAKMMHPEESQRLIREGVKRAVGRRGEIKPMKLPRPVRLEITFKSLVNAEVASYLPGVERPRGNAIAFNAKDMIEAARFLNAVTKLNTF